MIINKINIVSFAGIKNKIIELEDNINLIYGENEKGKSTIQNFIRIWLYGINSRRSKDIKNNDRVRFMPVDGEKIKGELYVLHKGRAYIIRRTFGATKKDDTSEILDSETGEEVLDIPKDEPGKYFINVNSQTFIKTLFIGQLGVIVTKDKEEEIIDKAANLLGSGEENISIQKALEKLENIKKSIITPRKNGELDLLRNKLQGLLEERYEGYKLSEENIDKEQLLINLKENRKSLRKELENLDIYKKYLKKSKLQKEYEEIAKYLKKKEELKKRERYIEESISSRNGVIDEGLLNDIKEENSLYFSLLDSKHEEEKKLKKNNEIYLNKRTEFEDLFFIEKLTSDDKNKFIRAIMEKEVLEEKIKRYEILKNDINLIKNDIEKKKLYIGSAINFYGKREEISKLLEKYEDMLKEFKFKLEGSLNAKKEGSNKLNIYYKYFSIASLFIAIILIIFIFFLKNNILLTSILFLVLLFSLFKSLTLKLEIKNNEEKHNIPLDIVKVEEDIKDIEKDIFKYIKLVEAISYEDFIKKIKLFDEFVLYEEKQNIKITEKEIQLSGLNIKNINESYIDNDNYINYVINLAKTEDTNEIILMISKYEEVNRDILSIKIDIEKSEENINKLEKELEIREKRIREKLGLVGLENIDLFNLEEKLLEIKQKIKQKDEIVRNLEGIEEAYKALTKDKDIDLIKEDLKDIINENINYDYSSEEEIDSKISVKSNELIEIEKSIKDVENHLNNRFIGRRSIPQIEEDLESVKQNINKLEVKLKAIELAIEKMNEAIREVRGNFGSILNSNVKSYFNDLAGDSYKEVMVSDSYDVKVRKGNEILPAAILSNGANDQLYLSLRLTFINMIYKDMDFPVILDDAFIQYDDIRTERAISLLLKCKFKQLLIFTCQSREKKIFEKKNIEINYIYL